MTEHVSIRAATASDVHLLLEFILGLARYEHLEHCVTATEDQLRQTLFGERSFAEALMAASDDKPAGFALFFHNYSTFLAKPGIFVEDVFVLPEFRRRGIGQALFAAVAEIAIQRGCGRLEWAVLDWNAPAISFYENMGAEVLPDWRVCRMHPPAMRTLAEKVPTSLECAP
jgi:GNAT superfamily N-acetyltransferase